jgi:predicted nuclease of predicted toxin-antitoxin system
LRFLLDAHLSGPRVGRRLEEDGHDVRALDQEPELERLGDDRVLALAAEEERILVTQDVHDFPAILREWAEAQRSHAGAILVYGIDHSEFELIIRGIQRWVELYPDPASWVDLTVAVDRDFASG